MVATQATGQGEQKAAASSKVNPVIIGMTADVIPPAAGDHTAAGHAEGGYCIPSAAGMASAAAYRKRPNHGISRAIEYWKTSLQDYPDKRFADKVLNYVEYGVDIGYIGNYNSVHCNNWPSATKFSDKVAEYIDNHLHTGAIEGPLTEVSQKYRTSPIGAFLKKDSEKVRVIHDLSHPAGISVKTA